ncbi:C-type lectin domain family 17, member A isoform X3 [Cervus canadensis]|uniref:C-type lectin domain family 17, member A isoform X3 n=1 Tax=Cervus canadensis TaxID=1574408 RepID=UPI001C9E787C|nr:C-type lectin domain family 17, member A isoform X3 [Cervus canadensis]
MCALYTNAGCRDLPEGSMEEDDDDDYENMTPPYKDLPPKPGWMAPPRPPRAGKKSERPPLPCKLPKNTGLNVTPVTSLTPQLGTDLMQLPSQSPVATTPVPWVSQKFGGLMCYQERLLVYLCLLVVVSLLMGCTSLVVTLIKYQEVVEELRMLTFQHMAWRANVTGMVGLAGLKKDLERIRADTNQSLLELRGLLDCTRVTCPEGWLPFQGKCYYFSPSTKTWDEARTFCQENYSHLVIISNSDEQVFVKSKQADSLESQVE